MSGFRAIVGGTALALLIVTTVIMAISMWRASKATTFPPVIGECPDYWTASASKHGTLCTNVLGMGNPNSCKVANPGSTMKFAGASWNGPDGNCKKAKWARKCGLTWDGLTNTGVCD